MQVVLKHHEVEQAVQAYLKAQYRIETDRVELDIDGESVQAFAEYNKVVAAPATQSMALKKRRSSAEVQAEREAKAKARSAAQQPAAEAVKPTNSEVPDAVPEETEEEDLLLGHNVLFAQKEETQPDTAASFLDGVESRPTNKLFP